MGTTVDVWLRGTTHATTTALSDVPVEASQWIDEDVRRLLSEMLVAIERLKNPDGDPPPVTLRGFSWIVSPDERGGVLVHLEMQMGTASAGPFGLDETTLSAMITRVIQAAAAPVRDSIH